jgi:hypothetical protein
LFRLLKTFNDTCKNSSRAGRSMPLGHTAADLTKNFIDSLKFSVEAAVPYIYPLCQKQGREHPAPAGHKYKTLQIQVLISQELSVCNPS